MAKLCFDYDFVKFKAAASCEKRTINVVHTQSGREKGFPDRTTFKEWLKDEKGGKGKWEASEFTIIDVQTPEPIEHTLQVAKTIIQGVLKKTRVKQYYGYIGKGDSFRLQHSTMKKYKGNRDDVLRPLQLEEVEDYIFKHHNAELITGIEADDALTIDMYQGLQKYKKTKQSKDKVIGVAIDKDALTSPGYLFNPDKMKKPMLVDGFGNLYLDEKGKVTGFGRKWFYFFLLFGDTADNFKPTCLSKTNYGEKSAYKELSPCQNDKECLELVVKKYKEWYPEPIQYTSWKGEVHDEGWLFFLQEIATMSYMLKYENDSINIKEVLDKLGVEY